MNLGDLRTSVQKFVRFAIGGLVAMTVVACGGGGGSPGTVSGSSSSTATTPSSISLLFSSTTLPSSGVSGTEVTVTALVKNSSNNAIASVPVTFSADSGALTSVSASTDATGKATALLSTSGDSRNRIITVTVKAGNITTTGSVNVTGTKVTISGPGTVAAGTPTAFAITVIDQAGVGIAGAPVTISSAKGSAISITESGGGAAGAPLTNSQGRVLVAVTGSQSGQDTLTAVAQGASDSIPINVNTASLNITVAASEANIETCTRIDARYENAGVGQNGTLNVSASRGQIYTNTGCTTQLGGSTVTVTNGSAQVYIKSTTVGVATITATIANGPTDQKSITFVAPLTSTATISVQPEPAVISPSGTGQSNTSTLKVVVRDGTSNNNLVKGAVVEFTILADQSGGSLSNPSVVTTGTDGSATVTFTAGAATTATNGVQIQARIQGTSKTAATNLTVARKSLFITAGTGNALAEPTNSTYRKDYTVFVTDVAGNPVSGVAVSAVLRAINYRKGSYFFDSEESTPDSGWLIPRTVPQCVNEDRNYNGILDADDVDENGNGTLEPRLPFNVSASGKTDASGMAEISIFYPQDRGGWTDVQLIVTGSVEGTEGTYTTATFPLPVLSSDLSDQSADPPGKDSPYGVNACNVAN